jgi:hypothetical protein
MVASCKSTTVTVGIPGVATNTYTKDNIAIALVVLDLVLGFWFWLSLLIAIPLEKLVTEEIQEGTLSSSQFTVVVK